MMGFRRIESVTTLAGLTERIKSSTIDLVITNTDFEDGDVCENIHQLRHGERGGNPFVVIIATIWDPTPERVRRVSDTGADDIVPLPLSTGRLTSRINKLVAERKPFVVTSDYIGPDRRSSSDRPTDIPLIPVPNTMASKARGEMDRPLSQEALDGLIAEFNLRKLERYGEQIAWLSNKLAPLFTAGDDGSKSRPLLERMLYVCEDVDRRLVGTRYAHISELCQSMLKQTQLLIKVSGKEPEKDVKLMTLLAGAIQESFNTSVDQSAAAMEIAQEIGR